MMGVLAVRFENPTGDANNKNTSHVGFAAAADSIAQACLLVYQIVILLMMLTNYTVT